MMQVAKTLTLVFYSNFFMKHNEIATMLGFLKKCNIGRYGKISSPFILDWMGFIYLAL